MIKTYFSVAACMVLLLTGETVIAQNVGVWNGSGTSSYTNDNVGIGVSMPDSRLHIIHNKKITAFKINFAENDISSPGSIVHAIEGASDASIAEQQAPNIIEIYSTGTHSFPLNMPNPIMWLNGQGKLGLGTLPIGINRLSIKGNTQITGRTYLGTLANAPAGNYRLYIGGSTVASDHIRLLEKNLLLRSNDNNHGLGWYGDVKRFNNEAVDGPVLYGWAGGALGINRNGNQKAILKWRVDGKVTIGDVPSMPGNYSLYVQNGILTEHVRVAVKGSQEWSDFVFDEDYTLRPLTEVSSYIAVHRHLPDVPSTAEVKRDGVDIGTMQAKLLQKVEELTLYLLKQQAEIDELRKGQNKH